MATRLLVLGLVRTLGRAHGYRVGRELMAWDADKWANTKTGSIYHALRQLSKEGYLKALPEGDVQDGARTDYEITEKGDKEFFALMQRALAEPRSRPDALYAGFAFMSALPREMVLELLRKRLAALRRAELETVRAAKEAGTAAPPNSDGLSAFQSSMTDAQAAWLESEIARIENGDYVFYGEGIPVFGERNNPAMAPAVQ